MRKLAVFLALLVSVLLVGDFSAVQVRAQAPVDQRVLDHMRADPAGEAQFLMYLGAQADLASAAAIGDRRNRKMAVASALAATAKSSQQPVLAVLDQLQRDGLVSGYESFFSVNAVAVRGREGALRQLARTAGVARIEAEDALTIAGFSVGAASAPRVSQVERNISQINADDVWALGFSGQGTIVSTIDTGVRRTHEALSRGYRCRGMPSHANCWFDAVNGISSPYDDHSHGSHVTGTMAGRRGIGVARRAQWIACKAFDAGGSGSSTNILQCSDFFMGLALSEETAVFTPDVINNSWGGGRGSTFFNASINAWIAAGIFPVFAIGNSGPLCQSSIGPGEFTQAFGIGAVTSTDTIASFSSLGRASSMNGGTTKPDIVAPGVAIRSAVNTCNTCYGLFSGTSMAAPHAAGTEALMLSKNGGLTPAGARTIVENTALTISDLRCGGTASDNNVYGHGRVDALRAVNATP